MKIMKLAEKRIRGNLLSNFVCLSLGFVLVALVCFVFSYAYLSDIDTQTKSFSFANVAWREVSNPTIATPIEYVSDGTANVNISRAINTNIRLGVRARLAPEWKDATTGNRVESQPPVNYTYTNLEGWTIANNGIDYYYNTAVLPSEDDQAITFSPTLTFSDENSALYAGLELVIEVTFEYHQADYVDYDNHPWAETAPLSWLNSIKG